MPCDAPSPQDQGTANVLLSNVSISIDWAAAAAGGGNDIVSVLVKIGDVNLKFAGRSRAFVTHFPAHFASWIDQWILVHRARIPATPSNVTLCLRRHT